MTEDEECRMRFSTVSMLSTPTSKPSEGGQDGEKEVEHVLNEDAEVAEEESSDQSTEDKPKEKTEDTKPKAMDPIRMFGILVPPALRSAQASFNEAVDGPVVRVAAVAGELRALEREIGRARKAVRKA